MKNTFGLMAALALMGGFDSPTTRRTRVYEKPKPLIPPTVKVATKDIPKGHTKYSEWVDLILSDGAGVSVLVEFTATNQKKTT